MYRQFRSRMKRKFLCVLLAVSIFIGNTESVFAADAADASSFDATEDELAKTSSHGSSEDAGDIKDDEGDDRASAGSGAGTDTAGGHEASSGASDEGSAGSGASNKGSSNEGASSASSEDDGGLDNSGDEGSFESSDSSSEASSDASSDASSEASSDASSESSSKITGVQDYDDEFYGALYEDDEYEVEGIESGGGRKRLFRSASLPEKYISPYLPNLRNQNPYGTCWAFSTLGLAEVSLMRQGIYSSPDLSELHLNYFAYHSQPDSLGGLDGDTTVFTGTDWLRVGGTYGYASNTLGRWTGAADESLVPYSGASDAMANGLDGSLAYQDTAHISGFYLQPFEEGVDSIKKLVQKYGAAGIQYYALNSTSPETAGAYNEEYNSYYNDTKTTYNHAVMIVGWDDSFPKEHFNTEPPADGAFLIRNSWKKGSSSSVDDNLGYSGYFWMSYYEATLGKNAYAMEFDPADKYDNNYQYDGGIGTGTLACKKAANIYTTKAPGGYGIQEIKAVTFYTNASNVDYTIDIYTDITNPSNPESGQHQTQATTVGITDFAGMYTVDLAEGVLIRENSPFSVVVTLSKNGKNVGIGCESGASNQGIVCSVSAQQGQSFNYSGGAWKDFGANNNRNFKIKAFTNGVGYTLNYEVGNGILNPQNPDMYMEGEACALLDPVAPKGYEFDGWFTDPGYSEESKKTEITSEDRSNYTLYAKWIHLPERVVIKAESVDDPGNLNTTGEMMEGGEYRIWAEVLPTDANQNYFWSEKDEIPAISVYPEGCASFTTQADGSLLLKAENEGFVTVEAVSERLPSVKISRKFNIRSEMPRAISVETGTEAAKDAEDTVWIHKDGGEGLKSLELTATLYDDTEKENESFRQNIAWSSSDTGERIISLSADQNKVTLTPVSPGIAYVYAACASDASVRTSIRVEVRGADTPEEEENAYTLRIIGKGKDHTVYGSSDQDEVTGLIELARGSSLSVMAELDPDTTNKRITWSSANAGIATVSSLGKITAKSAGSVIIFATNEKDELTAACKVVVYDPVTTLSINKKTIKLGIGQSDEISVTSILPTTACDSVTYISSNEAVASVDANGVVTAHDKGKAVISAVTRYREKTAKCTVTVGTEVENIKITAPANISVAAGKTLKLGTAFNYGLTKPINKEVTWKIVSSSPAGYEIASVNSKGVVTGKKEGTVRIVAMSTTDKKDGSYVTSEPVTVRVYVPVKKAVLNTKAFTLSPGKSCDLELSVTPTDVNANPYGTATGSNIGIDVRDEISWDFKNADDLYISGVTLTPDGNRCRVSAGEEALIGRTVAVTASFRPYGASKDTVVTCKVTLSDKKAGKLTVNPKNITVGRGSITEIHAALTPTFPEASALTWYIEGSDAYDSRNKLTFVDEEGSDLGYRVITGNVDENIWDSNKVFVKAVDDSTSNGKTKATLYCLGPTDNLYAKVNFTIVNEAVSVTLKSGSRDVTYTSPAEDADRIVSVATGKTSALKAVVYTDREAGVKAGNQKVTWRSSDTSVATVDSSGRIRGIKAGEAYIYAESADYALSDQGKESKAAAKAHIRVYASATKLVLDKKKVYMSAVNSFRPGYSSYGQYEVLSAVAAPYDIFDNLDDKNHITWTVDAGSYDKVRLMAIDTDIISSAKDIRQKQSVLKLYDSSFLEATAAGIMTQKGQSLAIKAIKPGTVKITATAPGGKKATATITVYTGVTNVSLKLAWNGKDWPQGAYDGAVTKRVTVSGVKQDVVVCEKSDDPLSIADYNVYLDLKNIKSMTLRPVLDYYLFEDGEGVHSAAYSDRKKTADEKAATALYKNTAKYAVNKGVNYRSMNNTIATVSSKGVITAKKEGTVYVAVSSADGAVTSYIKVIVR